MDSTPVHLVEAISRVDLQAALSEEPTRAWSSLSELSASLADTDAAASEAVNILKSVIGMMLDGARWDEPYSPLIDFPEGRSHIPADFNADELEFLSLLLPQLDDNQLSARIADVLFLRSTDNAARYAYAREATDRWLGCLRNDKQSRSDEAGWERAANIAARFKLEAQIEALIDFGLLQIREGNAVTAWRMARTMRRARFFADDGKEVAERLSKWPTDNADELAPHLRREMFQEAIHWSRDTSDGEIHANLRTRIGDSWWDEAKIRRSDSSMVARDFYANAYNAYRAVPRSRRSPRTVKRLVRLPSIIREMGDKGLS